MARQWLSSAANVQSAARGITNTPVASVTCRSRRRASRVDVRHHQKAATRARDEIERQPQHLVAGRLVEISRRLVGEEKCGLTASARPMATRCCCPPESCSG